MNQRLREHLRALWALDGTPHALGLAFGLGIVLGVIPGTGSLAAAACATALRLNLPLMVTGALITNPFTAPLIYVASYGVGKKLLGDLLPEGLAARVLVGTATGNLLLAIAAGLIGYLLVRLLVSFRRSRSRQVRPAR